MELILPSGPFEAYLFDLDGTIANTLPLHFQAWNKALSPHKTKMPEDLFYAWGGIPVPRTVELLNEKFNLSLPVELVTKAREEAYFELMSEIVSHAAVERIIKETHGKLPMAVVSGSARESITKTLTKLGLLNYFDELIGAEDYKYGKPHPEPFLTGAKKLKADPKKCLAFEDAQPGIDSALAAGMQVVRIPQRF